MLWACIRSPSNCYVVDSDTSELSRCVCDVVIRMSQATVTTPTKAACVNNM